MAKKNNKLSNNALATLVVAALLVSVVGVFMAVSRVPGISITGQQALNNTDTAQAQFTLQQVASITFARDTINFSTGFVNTSAGNTECRLSTNDTKLDQDRCINFTIPATPDPFFILENDGTINVTVELLSNASADQFIGGNTTINSFQWKLSQNETGSCNNLSSDGLGTGTTGYVEVSNGTDPVVEGISICRTESTGGGGLNFLDEKDSLRIDINITVPVDATTGTKRATLTATGTAV